MEVAPRYKLLTLLTLLTVLTLLTFTYLTFDILQLTLDMILAQSLLIFTDGF